MIKTEDEREGAATDAGEGFQMEARGEISRHANNAKGNEVREFVHVSERLQRSHFQLTGSLAVEV